MIRIARRMAYIVLSLFRIKMIHVRSFFLVIFNSDLIVRFDTENSIIASKKFPCIKIIMRTKQIQLKYKCTPLFFVLFSSSI